MPRNNPPKESTTVWRPDSGHQPAVDDLLLPSTWYGTGKVLIEFFGALALFVVALPVMLLLGVLVRLTSRGPAIYSQVRLGKGGRPFNIYKLRTMTHNCEGRSGPRWSVPGDSRVTWLGRILRRTHLDELPQLWNVLRGDMSLVGPRPERPEFVPELELVVPGYADRLLVRPGVTGLAQIRLPADTTLDSVRQKVIYDRYYVQNCTLWLDFRIVLCTGLPLLGVPSDWPRKLFRIPECDTTVSYQLSAISYQPGETLGEVRLADKASEVPVARGEGMPGTIPAFNVANNG